MSHIPEQVRRRRTFAIISHPDAGKTTLTEKLLLFSGAIQSAGTVKGKKGITYNQRASVCLETQHYPDSPNKSQWPSVVLEPGQIYNSECVFKFSVEK